jgi:WD repeat-containing protein 35
LCKFYRLCVGEVCIFIFRWRVHCRLGRKSGQLARFSLPHLAQESVFQIPNCEPYRIEMNCTSTKCALVDASGVMSVCDLEARVRADDSNGSSSNDEANQDDSTNAQQSTRGGKQITYTPIGTHFGKKLNMEKRDVWDIKWAEDNADMLCFMEKTKMCIMSGDGQFDEPVVSSGYLGRFKDLEVRVVTLGMSMILAGFCSESICVIDYLFADELLLHPEQPNKECVIDFETQSLRNARDTIQMKGLAAGYAGVEKSSHPRLWRLLAHCALEEMDLTMAERAFVRCGDYFGIQLVKQLRSMPDKMKAKAEIAMFFQHYDEAEAIYREIDRKDLAVQSRRRVGDYVRVVQVNTVR